MDDLEQRIKEILSKHLSIGGHDAWEGHYYYVAGIDVAAKTIRELLPPPLPTEVTPHD